MKFVVLSLSQDEEQRNNEEFIHLFRAFFWIYPLLLNPIFLFSYMMLINYLYSLSIWYIYLLQVHEIYQLYFLYRGFLFLDEKDILLDVFLVSVFLFISLYILCFFLCVDVSIQTFEWPSNAFSGNFSWITF